FRAGTFHVQLPLALVAALKVLSQQEGATLFMTLLAGFNILLRHYTGEERVVIGTDVANRPRAEAEALIGFFVNQLVLLTDLSGNPSFTVLLARVREVALGAFTHQELPFELLLDALKPEREALQHSPLFQVKLVLQNAPEPELRLPDLSIHPLAVENPYAKSDLLLTLRETAEGLHGTFEYQAELFEHSQIEAWMSDYELILRAAVADPNISLSELDAMLDEAERGRDLRKERAVKDAAQAKLARARRKPLGASAGAKRRADDN
ncbi:MAG TPA: condensation domain-containing protein, partial [Pyrinomonadaceae bacterium]